MPAIAANQIDSVLFQQTTTPKIVPIIKMREIKDPKALQSFHKQYIDISKSI